MSLGPGTNLLYITLTIVWKSKQKKYTEAVADNSPSIYEMRHIRRTEIKMIVMEWEFAVTAKQPILCTGRNLSLPPTCRLSCHSVWWHLSGDDTSEGIYRRMK